MRHTLIAFAAVLPGIAMLSIPVLAHHSFAAEFDVDQPVELQGTVLEVEWVNPHAWIHLAIEAVSGSEQWAAELGSPNLLMRNGWRSDSLKPGDEVVITGHRARDGSLLASARTVRMKDGERIFNAGSSGEQQ